MYTVLKKRKNLKYSVHGANIYAKLADLLYPPINSLLVNGPLSLSMIVLNSRDRQGKQCLP